MNSIVTPQFIIDIVCMGVAFFTFISLFSREVYLETHRLLPSIVALIIIFDFFQVIRPIVLFTEQKQLLYVLCNMAGTVITFMLCAYVCSFFLKKKRLVCEIILLCFMIVISAIKFYSYIWAKTVALKLDVAVGVGLLVYSLLIIFLRDKKYKMYASELKNARIVYSAFVITIIGSIIDSIFIHDSLVMTVVLMLVNMIFMYMAMQNSIEDTSSILASKMFELIDDPVLLIDKDFYLIGVNSACMSKFPFAKGAEFAFDEGRYDKQYLYGKNMILRNEKNIDSYISGKWYRVSWSAVENRNKVIGYIFTITDVTEQHEKMLAAKTEVAEKSQFLAHMSHELRSPLHAVIGASEILLDKHDISTKNRNLLKYIKKSSDGLLNLVDAILDYSKLEAGKFTFSEKKYSIDDIFDELTYNTVVNLGSKPVEFSIAVINDYPRYLFGDAIRVKEIFQNILSNAVKYTDYGSIRGEVSFEILPDEVVHITFSVADSGHGMSPDLIEEIFSEYISNADGDQYEGTGLGLSITRQIISLMGGTINAESDGITGSTFKGDFYQKLGGNEMLSEKVYNRRTISQQNNNVMSDESVVNYMYPDARILVADDMKINQEIMKELLSKWKCQVDCFSDGNEAINACMEHEYQLILLDQMMSPMTGIETAEKIRAHSKAPIILVTANTEDNMTSIVEACPFLDDFMSKPVHAADLSNLLDVYVSHEYRQKIYNEVNISTAKRDLHNIQVYTKTLETFVKEMQPLLLHLPKYATSDRELFKVKVHGIKGVSRQIGREKFSDEAEIMEMAAKSEHYSYIERHLDEFLTSLCDTVEEVTEELTQIAPDMNSVEKIVEIEETQKSHEEINLRDIFNDLLEAFDNFDIAQIETGLDLLEDIDLHGDELSLYSKIIDAYDELEYERGSEIIKEYLAKQM